MNLDIEIDEEEFHELFDNNDFEIKDNSLNQILSDMERLHLGRIALAHIKFSFDELSNRISDLNDIGSIE
jgi:hypothetical protein